MVRSANRDWFCVPNLSLKMRQGCSHAVWSYADLTLSNVLYVLNFWPRRQSVKGDLQCRALEADPLFVWIEKASLREKIDCGIWLGGELRWCRALGISSVIQPDSQSNRHDVRAKWPKQDLAVSVWGLSLSTSNLLSEDSRDIEQPFHRLLPWRCPRTLKAPLNLSVHPCFYV